jgi:hypothetical protein
MRRGGWMAVTTQLPIAGKLLGRQHLARLEMRGQMLDIGRICACSRAD